MSNEAFDPQEGLLNPAHTVYFRAGLIACREYMARFVGATHPEIAASIRANWWPSLGPDLGPPRQIEWGELTEGEYGTDGFRIKGVSEVSPTLEALAVAWTFFQSIAPGAAPSPPAAPYDPTPNGQKCRRCGVSLPSPWNYCPSGERGEGCAPIPDTPQTHGPSHDPA